MDQGFESQVKRALLQVKGFASIDDLVAQVSESIDVPKEFSRRAVEDSLKRVIRRQIKMFKDGDGLSQWESIERATQDGGIERVYKQLALFSREDYRLAIDYYANSCRYGGRKANTLTKRCNSTHKTRLPLPFPTFGLLSDEEEASA